MVNEQDSEFEYRQAQLDEAELDKEEEADEETITPLHYAITSYGADYPVDGLVKRLTEGAIIVPAFQRGYVWTYRAASRFIESLLLGLPVPGIFLSKEEGSQKLMVIDGQQRLLTLKFYYGGIFSNTAREFTLKGVQPRFEGKTYKTLQDEDRRLLDDSILHATVIKQDEPADDDSSIYQVFGRLNTGGTLLKPQEIRSALSQGAFTDLLKRINTNEHWRAIFGPVNANMRDQELILRFFALYYTASNYKKPMTEFLNSFMNKHRQLKSYSEEQLTTIFLRTIDTVYRCLGNQAFRPKNALNAAVFDAVMVGIAHRLEHGPVTDCNALEKEYQQLLLNTPFSQSTQKATTDEESVAARLKLATIAFASVQ